MNPDLIIHHISGDRFQVLRGDGVSASAEIQLPDPNQLRILGWEDAYDLAGGLRWYFEKYPRHPAPPFAEHAEQVLGTLDQWGREAFELLFLDHRARTALNRARESGPGWRLRIQSGDPHVLSWPWEALRDTADSDVLGLNAAVERCVLSVGSPLGSPEGLTQDRIRVLLVSARPFENDVGYRAISGAMMGQVEKHRLPVEITLLRPATYAALQEELRSVTLPYHVLHFDGHGEQAGGQGQLIFESAAGTPDPITARQLAQLLAHHPVPVIVLSACRSASLGPGNASPFSAIATELLRGRVRSVVAMSQVLHRDGAMQFAPAFYREMMQSGSVTRAVMRGRLEMQQNARRTVRGGQIHLRDAILPVVYQNQPVDLPFPKATALWRRPRRLADEATLTERLYGRDALVHRLEQAIQSKPRLTMVVGEADVGKTLLTRDLVTWLEDTGWSGRIDWIGLASLGCAGAVLNRMGMVLGQDFFGLQISEKIRRLTREEVPGRTLTVWDGLDAVSGWPSADQATLRQLIDALNTRSLAVIATSRELPEWLKGARHTQIDVPRLHGDWSQMR